jgi:hypothetical protein
VIAEQKRSKKFTRPLIVASPQKNTPNSTTGQRRLSVIAAFSQLGKTTTRFRKALEDRSPRELVFRTCWSFPTIKNLFERYPINLAATSLLGITASFAPRLPQRGDLRHLGRRPDASAAPPKQPALEGQAENLLGRAGSD